MIPTIETICEDLAAGRITVQQAIAWLYQHVEANTDRDMFAGLALQGLCANSGGPFQASPASGWALVNCTIDAVAQEAYSLADAMLKARGVLPSTRNVDDA